MEKMLFILPNTPWLAVGLFTLKKCIRNFPKDFPVRGAKNCKNGNWEYVNEWRDICSFSGKERFYSRSKRFIL
jgi:hypothetical protein